MALSIIWTFGWLFLLDAYIECLSELHKLSSSVEAPVRDLLGQAVPDKVAWAISIDQHTFSKLQDYHNLL